MGEYIPGYLNFLTLKGSKPSDKQYSAAAESMGCAKTV